MNARQIVTWTLSVAAALMLVLLAGPPAPASPAFDRCGWNPVGNVLFPDLNARYWKVVVPVHSAQQIRVTGQFPHARYAAYALQGPASSGDAIHDAQITPDAGSTNPFLAGADRTVAARSYTLHVIPEQAPASGRAPNTLYAGDGFAAQQAITLVYRIYDVDAAADQVTGGVSFPVVEAVDASGAVTIRCDNNRGGVTPGASFAPVPAGSDTGIGAVGTNPPSWQKFINTATAYSQLLHSDLLGDALYDKVSTATASTSSGGLGANVDNQYISALVNANYGKVLSLTATMPTHPQTYQGQSSMGTGQVRYWSMCSEVFATTQAVQCVPDHAVPLHGDHTFAIVVSAPADRPSNATEACGVAWLPMGTAPGTLLIMRNMLSDPAFAQGIGNAQLNHEADTMGSYYPHGQYYPDAAAYEAIGCVSD